LDFSFSTTHLSGEILSIDLQNEKLTIDLSDQPDQLRYSILQSPMFGKARYAVKDECLVVALNEIYVYTIDLNKEELLAQLPNRVENVVSSLPPKVFLPVPSMDD
jgi:hypothetical protein